MAAEKQSIDWSDKCWRDMLIYQRKTLWNEDTIKRFVAWMDIRQGMTAVDIGCGLGFLGYTYWPYFGQGGHYIGVDMNLSNLKDAARASREWSAGGRADFIEATAYKLPFPDNWADWVMCQVVLIHLKDPYAALAEMVRILKPGGLILCKEPDNESNYLLQSFNSLPQLNLEDQVLSKKVALYCNRGRFKLGHGDSGFGRKVPHALKDLGIQNIEIRNNDKVHFLEPPYDTPFKKDIVKRLKEDVLNEHRRDVILAREREHFIAAGGDPKEYDRLRELSDNLVGTMRDQIERGEYFSCSGGLVYIIKGRKP